jgi:hypothetical protein
MRMHLVVAGVFPLAALLAGCPTPETPLARAQQTAQEFNIDSRFGRGEILVEHVAPDAREKYMLQHRGWGASVRLADVEIDGMRPRGEHDVDVLVRVSWYRPEDQLLRSTTLRQSWSDRPGGWKLVDERRVEGEAGLLGEPVVYEAPAPRTPARFPTVRLTGEPESAAEPAND